MHEWLEKPFGEWTPKRDDSYEFQPKHIARLNALGADGWEVFHIREEQGWWFLLLKRKVS
jgi:hypothetical protein